MFLSARFLWTGDDDTQVCLYAAAPDVANLGSARRVGDYVIGCQSERDNPLPTFQGSEDMNYTTMLSSMQ